jgi:hypothetical protein
VTLTGQSTLEMSFLKQFWTTLIGFFRISRKEDSPPAVDPEDPLARFLTSRNHFSAINNRAKSVAFLPGPNRLLSVFLTRDLSEESIWEMADIHVAKPSMRPLYGRAEIRVPAVTATKLQVHLDNHPPRHASIIGWPKQKSEHKLLALQLAESAILKL